ncbi:MAG: glycosyltransferase family 4 protein [Verrucomicrobiota bacterium]|nr:glycosyltransferase family 4 protein [Verrucomicrobiota bacterium]
MGLAGNPPARKRVLFVDHVDRILGGGEINLMELLSRASMRKGWEIGCATAPNGELRKRLKKLPIVHHDYFLPPRLNSLRFVDGSNCFLFSFRVIQDLIKARGKLVQACELFSPDVTITCTNKDHLIASTISRKLLGKAIWWCNDILSREFFTAAPLVVVREAMLRSADHVVTVSHYARNALTASGIPESMTSVVHNGIDKEAFAKAGVADLQHFGVPEGVKLIGFVGRFTPWKGPELFLQIAEERIRQGGREHFVLVGSSFNEEGNYERRLREKAAAISLAGRVHFIPFQEEVAPVMRNFSLLMHTSIKPEPFGRVVIEAMALGVPVIAARAGAIPEILKGGVYGTSVPAGSIEAYVQAIDPTLDLGGAKAEKPFHFGLERVMREFELLVDATCEPSGLYQAR